ncbi:MAG: hypothetical protein U0797_29575 [Gemmataceae bacterium]
MDVRGAWKRPTRWALSASIAVTLLGVATADRPRPAVEKWADPKLSVTRGLALWLDAARLAEARKAAGLSALKDGEPLEVWPDGSGAKKDVTQRDVGARPTYRQAEGFRAVRFDGRGKYLGLSSAGQSFKEATVFVVAAPYPNRDGFPAFLSMGAKGKNDFETGLNIDQAVGVPPRFEFVNVEGAGSQGAKNLAKEASPHGAVVRLCVTSVPGKSGTALWINGKRQADRDRAAGTVLRADELLVGARYYTLGGPPQPRGFLHGDIAEVLVYDRALDDADRAAVEKYLSAKYGSVPRSRCPGSWPAASRSSPSRTRRRSRCSCPGSPSGSFPSI